MRSKAVGACSSWLQTTTTAPLFRVIAQSILFLFILPYPPFTTPPLVLLSAFRAGLHLPLFLTNVCSPQQCHTNRPFSPCAFYPLPCHPTQSLLCFLSVTYHTTSPLWITSPQPMLPLPNQCYLSPTNATSPSPMVLYISTLLLCALHYLSTTFNGLPPID